VKRPLEFEYRGPRLQERPQGDWPEHARCKGVDPATFFPVDKGRPPTTYDPYAAARVLCDACPVRDECLEYALEHEQLGMWGGRTPDERERIRAGEPVSASPIERPLDRAKQAAGEPQDWCRGNTGTYKSGCHCRACRAAVAARERRRYHRARAAQEATETEQLPIKEAGTA
jgi:WhiB family redox-sensing transcriptional regulator